MKMRTSWLILVAMLAGAAQAQDRLPLRLMTYNIRLDLPSDGVNAWANRRDWVAAQVHWLRPDIVGMQEVLPNQKADLAAALPQYRFFGGGRDGKDAGEASPIGFDTSRFRFLGGGVFWLSPTPKKPSKGWDAAYPRIVTWVRLRMIGSTTKLLAINTHWDHIGVEARQQSSAQMSRWIADEADHCDQVLVLGDFNSTLDSAEMRGLTESTLGIRDARAASKSAPFGPSGTFNDFKIAPAESKTIDHLLIDKRIDVNAYTVVSQVIDGRVPSDHFPVLADLGVTPCL